MECHLRGPRRSSIGQEEVSFCNLQLPQYTLQNSTLQWTVERFCTLHTISCIAGIGRSQSITPQQKEKMWQRLTANLRLFICKLGTQIGVSLVHVAHYNKCSWNCTEKVCDKNYNWMIPLIVFSSVGDSLILPAKVSKNSIRSFFFFGWSLGPLGWLH